MSNALSAGTRIGPYEIVALLGVGGMGEVYRARDPKLNRDVAIKVLLPAVANDPERLDRFGREAQVLASLNHPNIAQIYGIEDANGVRALVMELVEGPTLADRIAQGAIAIDESLPIAKQIAEALEAAHEQGIIHRDLKPANIKVRADGTVKVLDFGLAKALDPAGSASAEAANSPTLSMQATAAGVILGTAAYMAPEQARGRVVDKRADIWAFGCVLYEMLTGGRAFGGDDVTDTIVAVVSKEPDWQTLPAAAAGARPLLARCLKKDRKQRLQAIGDARIEIEELIGGTSEEGATRARAMPSRRATPGTIAALAVVAAMAALVTWALTRPGPPASLLPSRFEIVPPPAQSLARGSDRDIAISPDGRYIVYRGGVGGAQLIVRAVDRLDAQPVSSGSNARQPFFSPDSQWIGFFEGRTLKKVAIAGGAAITICQTALTRGASWGDDNSIVFATTDTTRGLLKVSAGGGEPAVLTTPDRAKGETNHWYPSVLPGGRGVLFTITARNAAASAQVAVLDLKTGQHKTLTRGSQAEYVEGGHLLYVADGTLHAVRFDLDRLELLGDPVPAVDGVWTAGGGAANYGVSRAGTLVYVPAGTQTQRSLVWVDRKGNETPIPVPLRVYEDPRLSPDGTVLALTISDQENDIYLLDLARETLALRRLTFGPSIDAHPVWTPDGHRIVFGSQRPVGNVSHLFVQAADGSGTAERLTTGQYWQTPYSITPDGTHIVAAENTATTASDIVWFPLRRPTRPSGSGPVSDSISSQVEPLIRTASLESHPAISPDGRYVAYQSNESGRNEIYVRPFPRVDEGQWQPSSGGGTVPVWARNGRELFYLDPSDRLTAVPVQASATKFTWGNPARVLDTAYASSGSVWRSYDVSPDGQRFLMIKENVAGEPTRAVIVVVLNWFEELKAKLANK
jgi:Tol biopolymer transport system component/tRNA A-37 threonylcarbamoyl transferase component Bud32